MVFSTSTLRVAPVHWRNSISRRSGVKLLLRLFSSLLEREKSIIGLVSFISTEVTCVKVVFWEYEFASVKADIPERKNAARKLLTPKSKKYFVNPFFHNATKHENTSSKTENIIPNNVAHMKYGPVAERNSIFWSVNPVI